MLLLFALASCNKDNNEDPEDPSQALFFQSLEAEKDTIESGESTKVYAVASGYKLIYYWSATAGDILGSGNEVVYAASPCHIGKNTITCTIKDGNNASRSKEIFIVVK